MYFNVSTHVGSSSRPRKYAFPVWICVSFVAVPCICRPNAAHGPLIRGRGLLCSLVGSGVVDMGPLSLPLQAVQCRLHGRVSSPQPTPTAAVWPMRLISAANPTSNLWPIDDSVTVISPNVVASSYYFNGRPLAANIIRRTEILCTAQIPATAEDRYILVQPH
ncbi:hypothetical protein GGR56DRAFT_146330 [Xylariaceae sp. FL0804]|nr:hypothetical protein GGR56DRAFT_146330 [Xylariaceae sp. FL0804]